MISQQLVSKSHRILVNSYRTLINSHRIPVIYCSEHETIVVSLHCQQYDMNYVNSSICCVSKQTNFIICTSINFFVNWAYADVRLLLHTPLSCMSCCLWKWLYFSSEDNALSSHSLFSLWLSLPRYIVTCTWISRTQL